MKNKWKKIRKLAQKVVFKTRVKSQRIYLVCPHNLSHMHVSVFHSSVTLMCVSGRCARLNRVRAHTVDGAQPSRLFVEKEIDSCLLAYMLSLFLLRRSHPSVASIRWAQMPSRHPHTTLTWHFSYWSFRIHSSIHISYASLRLVHLRWTSPR